MATAVLTIYIVIKLQKTVEIKLIQLNAYLTKGR